MRYPDIIWYGDNVHWLLSFGTCLDTSLDGLLYMILYVTYEKLGSVFTFQQVNSQSDINRTPLFIPSQ